MRAASAPYGRRIVNVEHGGRVTLRQKSSEVERVVYEGELVNGAETYAIVARVTLDDGAVNFDVGGAEPPAWLLEIARTTLRTAWHGYRAGTTWPRRLTRWRAEPEAS